MTSTTGHLKHLPIEIGAIYPTNSGAAIVIEYQSSTNVLIEFLQTKTRKVTSAHSLRMGKVKDPLAPSVFGVGYFSGESYRPFGRYTAAGLKWHRMLARCYDQNNIRAPYRNTSVASEWHDFKNFDQWFSAQPNNNLGYELDKDLLPLLRGEQTSSKQYGPQNCALIPRVLNLAVARFQQKLQLLEKARSVSPAHSVLPSGIRFDKHHQNYRISIGGKTIATRKRQLAAFSIFEQAIVREFIELIEKHLQNLSPAVSLAFAAYKESSIAQSME